jgi:hypothetical protein
VLHRDEPGPAADDRRGEQSGGDQQRDDAEQTGDDGALDRSGHARRHRGVDAGDGQRDGAPSTAPVEYSELHVCSGATHLSRRPA